jgi:hypothetical protein
LVDQFLFFAMARFGIFIVKVICCLSDFAFGFIFKELKKQISVFLFVLELIHLVGLEQQLLTDDLKIRTLEHSLKIIIGHQLHILVLVL